MKRKPRSDVRIWMPIPMLDALLGQRPLPKSKSDLKEFKGWLGRIEREAPCRSARPYVRLSSKGAMAYWRRADQFRFEDERDLIDLLRAVMPEIDEKERKRQEAIYRKSTKEAADLAAAIWGVES